VFNSAITQDLFTDCLTPKELAQFEIETTVLKMKKRQLVFSENGIAFGCYILLQGKAKLFKTGDLGKTQIFQLCCKGDLFGFHPVLNNRKYPDSAELLEDSELLFIPAAFLLQLLKSNNDLCMAMLSGLSTEFEDFLCQETMLAQKSVRERVCTVLYYLTAHYKNGNVEVSIPLSRADLADLCGTVKETLVRVLHDLKEEQIISTTDARGTILLLDVNKLKRLAEV